MCFLQNCFFLSYLWHCAQQRGRLFTSSAKLRIWEKVNNSAGNKDSKGCVDSKQQRYAAVLDKSSLNGKMLLSPSKEWISLAGQSNTQHCAGTSLSSFLQHSSWLRGKRNLQLEDKKKNLQLDNKTIFIGNKATCWNRLERLIEGDGKFPRDLQDGQ